MSTRIEPPSHLAADYAVQLLAAGGRLVHEKDARDAEIYLALYESPPYDLKVAPIDVSRLSVNLRTVAVTGRIGAERSRRYPGQRYSFFLTPAHADAAWRKEAPSRHVNIYFHRSALEEAADGASLASVAEQPFANAYRPALRPWVDALELAMTRDAPFVDDAAIGLARAILSMIVRPAPDTALAPTLSPVVLARLRDFVATHLAGSIRVADLAATAGMTPGRFVLAFKATTGSPPHRFLIEQRLRHASSLLLGSRLGLAEVAVASGFASQQHMTTLMRRVVGKTPAQLRRDAGGRID
jgi:AraC-like DNA-binding protein